MKRQDTKNLESSLAVKLEKILEGVAWLSAVDVVVNPADYDRAFDLLVGIGLPRGNRIELWVECKDMPKPSRFPYVSLENRFRKGGSKTVRVPTLAAPYISPRMAEMCEKHGWSWFDLAGNCRITVPELLHIERTGNKPVHSRPKREGANLSTLTPAPARSIARRKSRMSKRGKLAERILFFKSARTSGKSAVNFRMGAMTGLSLPSHPWCLSSS